MLSTVVLILTTLPVVLGLILGFSRGSKRSIARFILVILCIVATLILQGMFTSKIMSVDVDGQTFEEAIASAIPENDTLSQMLLVLVNILINVTLFMGLFLILKFLTWLIVYPIIKLFVGRGGDKGSRMLGALFGLIQGAAIAIALCSILVGTLAQVNKVAVAMENMQASFEQQETVAVASAEGTGGSAEEGFESMDVSGWKDFAGDSFSDPLVKFYAGVSDLYLDKIACYTDVKTGNKYTLSGQVDGFVGILNMAHSLSLLGDIGNGEVDYQTVLNNLQDIKNLPEESKQTINGMLGSVLEDLMSDTEGLEEVDFENIDYVEECEVIVVVMETANKEQITEQDTITLVETLADSQLITQVASSSDASFAEVLGEENTQVAIDHINSMDIDQSQKDNLLKLLQPVQE